MNSDSFNPSPHQQASTVGLKYSVSHVLNRCAVIQALLFHLQNTGRVDLALSFFKIIILSIYLLCFLGPQVQHLEVPRLGVELELQLLVYATATATWDLSCVCDLHHSSWQHWILNPLSEARDQTRNLMVSSGIRFYCATMGTLKSLVLVCSFHFRAYSSSRL